jgi:polar amino acid transport system substrate-binding protein
MRRRRLFIVAPIVCLLATVGSSLARAQSRAELVWGGDAEGGEPFVYADPSDTSRVIGFEVDIAQLLAKGLGRTARFQQVAFVSLDASAQRGDFDIGLSGIEDLPARKAHLALTVPYYQFRELLTVRQADGARFRTLSDLRGRRVATLGATLAYELLATAQREHGVIPVTYEDDVHPYQDLAIGRVDAVLLDQVLAERGVRRNPGLINQPGSIATGHYVGILSPRNTALRDRINAILKQAMRDGSLEAIFRRWKLWNDDQPALYASVLSDAERTKNGSVDGAPSAPTNAASNADLTLSQATRRYFPSLLRAAGITLVLSCLSMAAAVSIGILIASGRVYGPPPVRMLLTAYVELVRGTPLLLQLFVIYFGLAAVVQLPAFIAALVALALNYAAYESEIYRGALEAVPAGQLEAARTLGLSDRQTLMLVRGPQAFRLALAPMTNDFVALLKDSSLVSVITVVELTKQTSIFAANVGTWVVPGAICAALYLLLSLPVAHLARRLERSWRAA